METTSTRASLIGIARRTEETLPVAEGRGSLGSALASTRLRASTSGTGLPLGIFGGLVRGTRTPEFLEAASGGIGEGQQQATSGAGRKAERAREAIGRIRSIAFGLGLMVEGLLIMPPPARIPGELEQTALAASAIGAGASIVAVEMADLLYCHDPNKDKWHYWVPLNKVIGACA